MVGQAYLSIVVAEVVPAIPDANGRGGMAQLGREDFTGRNWRGPDRHVLVITHKLTVSNPCLGLDLEWVILARSQTLDCSLTFWGIEITTFFRDECLTFLGR